MTHYPCELCEMSRRNRIHTDWQRPDYHSFVEPLELDEPEETLEEKIAKLTERIDELERKGV